MSWLASHVRSTSFIFLACAPFLLAPVMSIGIAFCSPRVVGVGWEGGLRGRGGVVGVEWEW